MNESQENVNASKTKNESDSIGKLTADKIAEEFKYGDAIKHEWFYAEFELDDPNDLVTYEDITKNRFEYCQLLNETYFFLARNHQMALKNRRGFGYEIIQPREQTSYAEGEAYDKIGKAIGKCQLLLNEINLSMLNDPEKVENREAICRISRLEQMYDEQRRKAKK
jgi:hypothetical protein